MTKITIKLAFLILISILINATSLAHTYAQADLMGPPSPAEAAAEAEAADKASDAAESQAADAAAAKEAKCKEDYGVSCKEARTPTDLTEGTFPVNEVLILDNGEQPKKYFNDFENASPLVAFIVDIIDFATTIMGSIAVILLIVAGFMFMFAYGNQQTLDKAKEIVTYAVIGLAVTFLSYIIVISVQSIFIAD